MANLVDTSVNGDLRVTGTMFGTQAGNYATCATAGATAAKAVTISGFTLTTGIHVFVKFTVTNTAAVASLTLNVSGTGAKAMKYRGGNLPAVGTLSASRVYEFIYDGTNWELVGDLDTNTQTVTGVKGNSESTYRTGNVNITAANVGASASDHAHGNIGNGGTLTDTAAAAAGNDYVVIRDADNNKVQTSTIKGTDVADAVSKKHSHSTLTLSTTAQAYDGSHTLALPASDPYTSARTPSSHTHGNITNGGALQTNDITIANGDKLVVTDSSDSSKVARTSLSFDGSTTTKALTPKGTWESFAKSSEIPAAANNGALQLQLNGGTATSKFTANQSGNSTLAFATGSSNGTISVDGTDIAVKGLGGAAYLNTGTASGTVATGNHTHTTSIASDSSSGTVVTLAHNTQYKLTAGGTSVLFKTPADSNTDTKVTQTKDDSSTGTGFEVLFSETADNTTRTEASRKSSKLTFQPSTGTLTATKFSGPLTGNVTGNCSGSSGSCTGNSATATSAGKLTTARKAYVTLGIASTTTTVDWSADPTTIPVDGTLAVSHGGTGMTTSTNVNAVVIGNSTTATNAMQTVRTGNGAFYATAQDAKPQFGTLPAAQGGTGKTSAKDACNAFINALDTGSSTPVDADYYVSQYVSGGTTTTTYHRRPMSALWTYIKGKLTSVSGVNISGNAATATKINTSAKIGDTNKPVYIAADGTVTPISYTIATSVPSGAVFTDTKVTQNLISTSGSYPVILKNSTTATDSPTSTVNYGASITANPGTGQLHATTFDVNSKCTLQFNTTTNALDFVFN